MIEKQWDTYILVCDICGEKAETEYHSWDDAVYGKKNEGWQSKKDSNVWLDVCPNCQNCSDEPTYEQYKRYLGK